MRRRKAELLIKKFLEFMESGGHLPQGFGFEALRVEPQNLRS